MDFDQIICSEEQHIHMGVVRGAETVLFIKTGQGGSIYGYENKYLELARAMNEKFGCSVFVSATISDSREAYEQEMQIVEEFLQASAYQIYYMGVSKGGLIGCWYGATNSKIKKIVSINAPLMINFQNKTLPAITSLSDKLAMYYGTLDPSYRFVDFAKKHVPVNIIEGADHHFSGCTKLLADIVLELLSD